MQNYPEELKELHKLEMMGQSLNKLLFIRAKDEVIRQVKIAIHQHITKMKSDYMQYLER